jgi:diguanylate cyclase (GGDEF)-like protein
VDSTRARRPGTTKTGLMMRVLFGRSSAVLGPLCLVGVLSAMTLCGIGIAGLHAATQHTQVVTDDEVADTASSSRFAHAVDLAYSTGLAVSLHPDEPALAAGLYNEQIPEVEARLLELQQIHGDEAGEERDRVRLASEQWAALRAALNDPRLTSSDASASDGPLRELYVSLAATLEEMLEKETSDAGSRNDQSTSEARQMTVVLVGAGVASIALFVGLSLLAGRRIRRELEPARDQVEFADTLQLAETEEEAHQLLQRRLMRVVPDSFVTVLNRNNSADRLEPMTAVPTESGLTDRLEHANPRACLAIRSARPHEEDPRRPGLLGCEVCQPCGGFSACTPLTVSGEVIGSVLMNRAEPYPEPAMRQTREAVSQAAPVLANLRNLAIAELRAATDALTGLPNKRAVADNLNRMFAQASRTATPMALVLLDLDHFKSLNDRFGHPVGDQVLAAVGATMRSTLRESDFAGRNGGEEFAIVLPGTDTAGAVATAETLRAAISDIAVPGVDVDLSASFGVATYPEHALSPERLERLADAALYLAKRSGRDRVEVATETDGAKEEVRPLLAGGANGRPAAATGTRV